MAERNAEKARLLEQQFAELSALLFPAGERHAPRPGSSPPARLSAESATKTDKAPPASRGGLHRCCRRLLQRASYGAAVTGRSARPAGRGGHPPGVR